LALVFSKDEIDNARKEGKLLSMDIELSKLCNLRCSYCYAAPGERQKDELGLEEIIDLIDGARPLGLRTLTLTGGEPLVDEKYFPIVQYARKKGLSVLLFTNGTLVTKGVARKLLDLRVSPCVKLDALSPIVQDRLAGVKGAHDKIKEGINNLISVGYTTKYPVLSVNATLCKDNLSEMPELWSWARSQNIIPSLTRLQPMGRARGRTDLMVTPQELHELFITLSNIDKGFGITWEPDIPWHNGKACRRHYIGCFIDCQGNVQPCSGVPIKAGSIRKSGLEEILASAEVFRIARNMENKLEGNCERCKHKVECYGCRSIAYFAGNGFTGTDTLCWHGQEEA
jgi:radical SAM protein with 4Fe4S-binding SPASM domain